MSTTPNSSHYAFYFGLFGLLVPLVVGIPIVLLAVQGDLNNIIPGILGIEFLAIVLCPIGAAIGGNMDRQFREKHGIDDRQIRASRAQRWFRIFLLLIPLGLASCPVGFVFGGGTSAGQLVAFQALILPLFGLGGVFLLRGDREAATDSLYQQELAERMGFAYTEFPPPGSFEWVESMRLWNIFGWTHTLTHIFTGKVKGQRVAIVHHTLHDPERGALGFSKQTLYILGDVHDLPSFALVPRTIDYHVTPFGEDKVVPIANQQFADRFSAVGAPRAAALLTPEVCECCLACPNRYVEVREGHLISCVRHQVDRSTLFLREIDDLLHLAAALRRANSRS